MSHSMLRLCCYTHRFVQMFLLLLLLLTPEQPEAFIYIDAPFRIPSGSKYGRSVLCVVTYKQRTYKILFAITPHTSLRTHINTQHKRDIQSSLCNVYTHAWLGFLLLSLLLFFCSAFIHILSSFYVYIHNPPIIYKSFARSLSSLP